jgi:predicted acyl esterase
MKAAKVGDVCGNVAAGLCCRSVSGLVCRSPAALPGCYGANLEKLWIPMKDGVRLAASRFMSSGGKPGKKFPALLEYLPYPKDEGAMERDHPLHTYFAHRGYVTARVDIRGTGAHY